jgi:long-chain acyl-CoA synthetase
MEDLQTSGNGSASEPKRLFDFCERNAHLFENSLCFVKRDTELFRSWTWGALLHDVLETADFLQNHHVVPQARVLNLSSNSLEWILIELACSCLNAIHVPIDPRLPQQSVLRILQDTKPVLVITENSEHFQSISNFEACLSCQQLRSFIDRPRIVATQEARQIVSTFQEQDVANILFTSGTTSMPKGVMLSHRNLVKNAIAKLDAMPQFSSDHRLNILPFSHAYAKTCELATWLISASSLEIASRSRELIDNFSIARPTLFNGVPLLFKRIHAAWQKEGGGAELLANMTGGRIRQLASGGAPIHDDLRFAFERSGLPIFQGYGLTEAGPVVCSNRSGASTGGVDRCLVGVGPAVNGVELKIDDRRRLWVRGDGVMLGYWNDPKATNERFKHGWLDTGDVAELDEFGNLSILGRSDDTIVLENGYKIDPLGIEQLICNIPGVRDCAMVPNSRFGYDAVLLCEENRAESRQIDIEGELRALLNKHVSVLPGCVVLTTEDWSESNGFRNFKGAKNRSKIASLVQQ